MNGPNSVTYVVHCCRLDGQERESARYDTTDEAELVAARLREVGCRARVLMVATRPLEKSLPVQNVVANQTDNKKPTGGSVGPRTTRIGSQCAIQMISNPSA